MSKIFMGNKLSLLPLAVFCHSDWCFKKLSSVCAVQSSGRRRKTKQSMAFVEQTHNKTQKAFENNQ